MATLHSHSSAQRQPYGGAASIKVDDIRFNPIPEELFGNIADRAAKAVSEGTREVNKPTQLRRFYDELVLWHEKVHHESGQEAKDKKYNELAPFIKMMKAKVAYAKGRKHVDENFEKLFTHLVDQIQDAASLRHAKLFMEAFMGFYKLYKQN